jgi:UDP-2,3-diacylglucosamine hydrolase
MTLDAAPWRSVEFIADLHLCAELPRTAEALLDHLRHSDADAIMLLGDIFEAWVGDDMALQLDRPRTPAATTHDGGSEHAPQRVDRGVPDADFERAFSAELADIAATRWIGFMVGNRDFLVGPAWMEACHLHALADPTRFTLAGQQVLVSHGDQLCLADTDYQQFRALVRSAGWQQTFLAKPLDERLAVARQMRQASIARQQAPRRSEHGDRSEHSKHAGQGGEYADVDHPAALTELHAAGAHTLVHGHTHRPGRHVLAEADGQTWQRLVLSDWDLDQTTPPRAEVLRLDARGFTRLAPCRAPGASTGMSSGVSPGASSGLSSHGSHGISPGD